MAKYLISARKWLDRKNGNTYFSLNVIDVKTSKSVVNMPFEYGYGDHYRQVAYSELVKLGLVDEKDRNNHELNRKRFIYVCSYVTTMKELKEMA